MTSKQVHYLIKAQKAIDTLAVTPPLTELKKRKQTWRMRHRSSAHFNSRWKQQLIEKARLLLSHHACPQTNKAAFAFRSLVPNTTGSCVCVCQFWQRVFIFWKYPLGRNPSVSICWSSITSSHFIFIIIFHFLFAVLPGVSFRFVHQRPPICAQSTTHRLSTLSYTHVRVCIHLILTSERTVQHSKEESRSTINELDLSAFTHFNIKSTLTFSRRERRTSNVDLACLLII